MSRLARRHVEEQILRRFPGSDVMVDRETDGGLRIEVSTDGRGTLIAISGAEPSTVLQALMSPPQAPGA